MNPGHQPQRFQLFTLSPDSSSFTIKDSQHTFYLDRYGGWFDQYGNYYNQNGQPDDPPSQSSQSYSEQQYREQSLSQEEDEFEKQFGRPNNLQDEEDEQQVQKWSVIAQNQYILETYPKNSYIRVYFQNLSSRNNVADLMQAYKDICKGIANIVINKDNNSGYFIVKGCNNALDLIQQQGKSLLQRPLYFQVQKYEESILNPVTEQELKPKQQTKAKKYVAKQQKPMILQAKKQPEIVWSWFKFQKNIFPKKTSFKSWMEQNRFIFDVDFKNVQKLENDVQKKYVKIQMKSTTFNSVNGLQFQGKRVQFVPL